MMKNLQVSRSLGIALLSVFLIPLLAACGGTPVEESAALPLDTEQPTFVVYYTDG